MNDHEKLRLRDPEITPTSEVLEQTLGGSYAAYETFQDALPGLEIEQEWQWYTPHKVVVRKRTVFLDNAEGNKEREKPLLAPCL